MVTGFTSKIPGNVGRAAYFNELHTSLGQRGLNVKDPAIGAVGDGVADDTTALITPQTAVHSAGGGLIWTPRGSYKVTGSGPLLRSSNAVFRGEGMWASKLLATTSITGLILSSSSLLRQNVVFEDMAFDATNTVQAIALNGAFVQGVTFRRCRFIIPSSIGFTLSGGLGHIRFEDCLFYSTVPGCGRAVLVQGGGTEPVFRRCRFLWLLDGITVDTGGATSIDEDPIDLITIDDCYFDLGWQYLPYRAANSGGTVTYSATVLTDSAAAFASLGLSLNDNVRAMAVLESGTFTSIPTSSTILDTTATFVTNSVLPGHIIRSGTKFAVVMGVQSETELHVEEWWDDTTREPVSPPANGASYTVYSVAIGRISSSTGTTITVPRFHDLDGATVTPSAGTRYEVMNARPNYPIHIERGARRTLVSRSILRRGWSDQISIFAGRATLTDNRISDGQDMGITLQNTSGDPGHDIVIANRVERQGAGCIWSNNDDGTYQANELFGWQTQNHVETVGLGGLHLVNAKRNRVIANVIDGIGLPHAYYGVLVKDDSDDNLLQANLVQNTASGGINTYATGANVPTGNKYLDNDAALNHDGGGNIAVGQFIRHTGTGSPETVYKASVGSQFARTDGGAGTCLYIKESGTGNTGWVAK